MTTVVRMERSLNHGHSSSDLLFRSRICFSENDEQRHTQCKSYV